jgi:hypothetical protein
LPHAARTAEVVVAPSVSTMILRASSYIPPDVSERNLIACGLQKGMSLSSSQSSQLTLTSSSLA